MKPKHRLVLAALVAALAVGIAQAQTLYKLIDKKGKVTYAEKPPKDFDGQVIPLTIDPNANTATLPKAGTPPPPPSQFARPTDSDDRVKAARERVEAARKAYQNAVDNPKEGEVAFIGKVGGGARPVQSEAYAKRLSDLENAVKDAEEDLKRAERG
ncbi:MAG TPA: hypothetical protein VM073_06725 [Usitatibacter sp.]|nr:hypothetical protein [Usitatibacter sp.]